MFTISRTYVDHLASLSGCAQTDPEEFLEAVIEARVTVAGLGLLTEVQEYFDEAADHLAKEWLEKYWPQIKLLSDDRKESYRQIIEMSTEPQDVDLVKPEAKFELTKVRQGDSERDLPIWKNHLLCDANGDYPAELNDWEQIVVERELKRKGSLFWYRNPQQPGQSSLGISYQAADQHKILRPDFIFFAEDDGEIVADIVDPHGHHLADAIPKLQGMAMYAEKHAGSYRRIESVSEIKGKLRVLDLTNQQVRHAISMASDASTLFTGALANDYS